jgi:VanZ family protein
VKTILFWLIMVSAVSLFPERIAPLVYGADKAFHFIIYAITCALFFTEVKKHLKVSLPVLLVVAAVLASGYGLLMEFAQVLIKSRSFSLYDALANALGAVAAAVTIAFLRRKG